MDVHPSRAPTRFRLGNDPKARITLRVFRTQRDRYFMTTIVVTDLFGETRAFDAADGDTLMQNITGNGFEDMQARCGGNCKCCTCHIYVRGGDYDRLPEMREPERALLTTSPHYVANQSRLACQIGVTGDLDGMNVEIVNET